MGGGYLTLDVERMTRRLDGGLTHDGRDHEVPAEVTSGV